MKIEKTPIKEKKEYDKSKEVGAIWVKDSGLSIQLNDNVKPGRYFAFENKFKTEEKHPDYRIVAFDK